MNLFCPIQSSAHNQTERCREMTWVYGRPSRSSSRLTCRVLKCTVLALATLVSGIGPSDPLRAADLEGWVRKGRTGVTTPPAAQVCYRPAPVQVEDPVLGQPDPTTRPKVNGIITDAGGCNGCSSAFVSGIAGIAGLGLATWGVIEPSVDLWLVDTPLRYNASRSGPVSFKLQYKNRQGAQGTTENAVPGIFSVGSRWHTPWRAYLEAVPTESTNFWVYLGDGSAVKFTLDKLDYGSLAKLTQVSSTNVIQYPDGSMDVFGQSFVLSGVSRYFLTRRDDVYGNAIAFQYVSNNNTIRLDKILDVDNRSITFEYSAKGNYSNVITKVIGPHGLTNVLQYDPSARLTNITDSVGLRSQMQYDANNVTSLITPYGTTSFSYFTISNFVEAVKITEQGVRSQLYLWYRQVEAARSPPITPVTCPARRTAPFSPFPILSTTPTPINATPSTGARVSMKISPTMSAPISTTAASTSAT